MRLNLCSGPNLFPGWINVDKVDQTPYIQILREAGDVSSWPEAQQKLVEHVKADRIQFYTHDARERLPFDDNSIEAIYLGQCVEHFNRGYELPGILKECLRVLKPTAPIRITTPDLQLLLDSALAGTLDRFTHEQPEFFANALPEDRLSYLMFGAMGPRCTTENYEGHFHLFTERSLTLALREAGFHNVYCPEVSVCHAFRDVVDCGMSHSLAAEAVK